MFFLVVGMSMKSVLAEELKIVSPSREDILELEKVAKGFIASLKAVGVKAFVGGSLAKGTVVHKGASSKDDSGEPQDIDIFVVFDFSEDILKLEGILKKLKLPGVLKRVHGSRDYFQVDCAQLDSLGHQTGQGVLLEVIPVVKNKDPELAENVTDVSLRHVKYVAGEIKKNVGLGDDIRLAKAFCYANRVYGAESYIKGLSGYALEVLVIHYGSFVKFLKNVGKRRVVDSLKYFKNEAEVLRELNASKLVGPLVVVDPTYKYRNVTAGLGEETFERFRGIARAFLKNPSLDFFEMRKIDVAWLKDFAEKRGVRFVELDLKTDRQEGDIAGTKMKKLLDFFVRELARKGQKVLRKEFDYSGSGQKAKGYLVIEEMSEIEVRGPSTGLADAVKAFKKAKGNRVFEKGGYFWFRDRVSVESVFESVKKVMGEIGAVGKLVLNS